LEGQRLEYKSSRIGNVEEKFENEEKMGKTRQISSECKKWEKFVERKKRKKYH
jgi:hypothetical protein